jgi:glycosyltransferase involved in cell wall biosynthesis
MSCGLSNNGGTRTILKSNDFLKKIGYDSCIYSNKENKFTWFHVKDILKKIPEDIDVLIATGAKTVDETLKSNAKLKIWYIRAHETWCCPEEYLVKLYHSNILKIVNSEGLKKKLISFGVKSEDIHVIYQGIDFEMWREEKKRKEKKINIGCLFSEKKRKNFKDFVNLYSVLGDDKYNYYAFGAEDCKFSFLKEYFKNPTIQQLNYVYNKCDIWFAPTTSEGLHNVPMEAALCGCLIMCNNVLINGMVCDYAFHNETALIYKDIEDACNIINNIDVLDYGCRLCCRVSGIKLWRIFLCSSTSCLRYVYMMCVCMHSFVCMYVYMHALPKVHVHDVCVHV